MDDDGAKTLLAVLQGFAVIKRRKDGKIVYRLPGDGGWIEVGSVAAAAALLRASKATNVALINVEPHETESH